MPVKLNERVSIKYTLGLEDGTILCGNTDGERFDYTPGLEEIMPVLEVAMDGAVKGDKRRIVISPETDHRMELVATRLAYLLGHEGEPLVLNVEIL